MGHLTKEQFREALRENWATNVPIETIMGPEYCRVMTWNEFVEFFKRDEQTIHFIAHEGFHILAIHFLAKKHKLPVPEVQIVVADLEDESVPMVCVSNIQESEDGIHLMNQWTRLLYGASSGDVEMNGQIKGEFSFMDLAEWTMNTNFEPDSLLGEVIRYMRYFRVYYLRSPGLRLLEKDENATKEIFGNWGEDKEQRLSGYEQARLFILTLKEYAKRLGWSPERFQEFQDHIVQLVSTEYKPGRAIGEYTKEFFGDSNSRLRWFATAFWTSSDL